MRVGGDRSEPEGDDAVRADVGVGGRGVDRLADPVVVLVHEDVALGVDRGVDAVDHLEGERGVAHADGPRLALGILDPDRGALQAFVARPDVGRIDAVREAWGLGRRLGEVGHRLAGVVLDRDVVVVGLVVHQHPAGDGAAEHERGGGGDPDDPRQAGPAGAGRAAVEEVVFGPRHEGPPRGGGGRRPLWHGLLGAEFSFGRGGGSQNELQP